VGRAYTGVIHSVFDQIPSLKKYFTNPNKTKVRRGPHTDKNLPPNTFAGHF
jgi:hypothetical protein